MAKKSVTLAFCIGKTLRHQDAEDIRKLLVPNLQKPVADASIRAAMHSKETTIRRSCNAPDWKERYLDTLRVVIAELRTFDEADLKPDDQEIEEPES